MAEEVAGGGGVPSRRPWWQPLRTHLPFLALLGIAAAVYVAGSWYQWVDLDEGLYLGAANSVVHGSVPYVDFAAREPVLIYWLALGISLFGPSLFVGRLMVDVLVLVAAAGVYATTSRVARPWAGLAAAAIFLLNPFDVYYGSIIAVEAAVAAPLAWSLYFFFRKPVAGRWDVLIAGLLLGVGVLTLRDAIALAPLGILLIAWQSRSSLREALVRVLSFAVGVVLTLGTVLAVLVSMTSFSWIWTEMGPSPGYFTHVQPFAVRLGTLGYMAVVEPALLVLVALAPAGILIALGHRWWGTRAGELSLVLVVAFPWLAVTCYSWGSGDLLFEGVIVLGLLLLFTWLGGLRALDHAYLRAATPGEVQLLTYSAAWIAIDVLIDGIISGNYFVHRILELSLPGSVIGGVLLARLVAARPAEARNATATPPTPRPVAHVWAVRWERSGRTPLAVALTVLLVGSSLFAAVAVLGPSNPYNEPYSSGVSADNANQRPYPLSEVTKVADYLDANSPAGSTLFSGDLAFLTAANRLNLLNLSIVIDLYNRPLSFNSSPLGSLRSGLVPSWSEIFAAWNSTNVPLVVVGFRTMDIESNFPYLATYIHSRYSVVQTFGNQATPAAVQVWKLGPPPVDGDQIAHATGPGTSLSSTAYLAPEDLVAVSAWNSRNVSFFEASTLTPCGEFTLPSTVPGVRLLAFEASTGELWVATLSASLFALSVSPSCVASTDFVVPLTAAPTALAFDPDRGHVLILEQGISTAEVANDTTGAWVVNYPVLTFPAAVAIVPASNIAYVTSGTTPYLAAYNITSGHIVSIANIGFPANNIWVAGSTLLVTQASPGILEWLNPQTYASIATFDVGADPQGFSVENDTLAVGSYSTGYVWFLNTSNETVVGSVPTGACPATVTLFSSSRQFLVAGACGGSFELWKLRPLVRLSLGGVGDGNSVQLDGLTVASPAELELLPGVFWINVSGPGLVGMSLLVAISENMSWDPSLGATVSSVETLQTEFLGVAVLGAIAAAAVGVAFPPPPDPPTRPRSGSDRGDPPDPEPYPDPRH